jgi:hypothetical protein
MSRIVIVILIVFSGYYEKWDISDNIFERSSADVKIFSYEWPHNIGQWNAKGWQLYIDVSRYGDRERIVTSEKKGSKNETE